MSPWHLRSPEVAHLLNPAFCGHIIYEAVKAYSKANETPFPYPLVFIVLPLALHRATRESMSARSARQFQVWLAANPSIKIGFAQRARQLSPFAREAVTFLVQGKSLIMDHEGGLASGAALRRARRTIAIHPEVEDCLKKAALLGKWFATAGPAATVFVSLGVKP